MRCGELPGSRRRGRRTGYISFSTRGFDSSLPDEMADRTWMVRAWLRRELEAAERARGPLDEETEYEALLRELLAVIDRHTLTL